MGGLGKKGDSMYTYVGKKRLSGPKAEVEDILEELVDVMEERHVDPAFLKLVGSVRSNLVTADEDGHFDLDYNICFSTAAFLILTYDKQVECSHGSVMSHGNMTIQ